MAINIAFHMGARQIALLGFDMQFTGGQSHWHGDHRKTSNPTPCMVRRWVPTFIPMWADLKSYGVELVNCTRETALTIPRRSLEDVLSEPRVLDQQS